MKGFRALRLGSQGKVEFEVYPVLEEYAQQGSVGGLLEARLPWRPCWCIAFFLSSVTGVKQQQQLLPPTPFPLFFSFMFLCWSYFPIDYFQFFFAFWCVCLNFKIFLMQDRQVQHLLLIFPDLSEATAALFSSCNCSVLLPVPCSLYFPRGGLKGFCRFFCVINPESICKM